MITMQDTEAVEMTNEEIFDKEFEELEKEDLVASLDVKPFRGWIILLMEKARADGIDINEVYDAFAKNLMKKLNEKGAPETVKATFVNCRTIMFEALKEAMK